MKRLEQRKQGFTLIELLIVIAIIGMLASIVLVSLAGGRAKAMEARYIAYVSSVTTLVEGAIAVGDFDDLPSTGYGCLGTYDGNRCWGGSSLSRNNPAIAAALSGIGSFGEGVSSPYNKDYGVFFGYSSSWNPKRVYIYVYAGSGHTDMCDKFGWANLTKTSSYCYGQFYIN